MGEMKKLYKFMISVMCIMTIVLSNGVCAFASEADTPEDVVADSSLQGVEAAKDSVVQVVVYYTDDNGRNYILKRGSGFLISENTVLTNYEVTYLSGQQIDKARKYLSLDQKDKDKELSYYKYYNKDNMKKLLGFKNDENNNIYINSEDYEEMFSSSYYQSSVFIKDESLYKQTLSDLEKLNIKTLYVKDTLDNYYSGELAIIKIVKVVALSCLLIALFFISYFVIKIILKSRNIYFATLRILGVALKSMKQILNIELLTITNIAYIIFLTISLLLKNNIIPNTLTSFRFLLLKDYIIIYIITIIMSLLISNRFSSKLFNFSLFKSIL